MSVDQSPGSSGAPANPSGNVQPGNSDHQDLGNPGGTVSYETHRKLLSEKKRRDEELAEARAKADQLAADLKAREEKELREKEDFKKLLEIREKELLETKAEAQKLSSTMAEARKLDAFMRSLNGQVPRKYWGMIDTDSIVIDPSTGNVDEMSVGKAVENFRKEFPEIVQVKGAPIGMPTAAPGGSGGTLTMDQWKALPLKEKVARQKDVEGFKRL